MIRAPLGDITYWIGRVRKFQATVIEHAELGREPSPNPVYEPQFQYNLVGYYVRLILLRYSRGDRISDLSQHFLGLLDAWELSNRLSDEICKENHLQTCRDWDFSLTNLNHYNWCFWLVGLALTLEIPDDQWQRLLILIGGEGEDMLLDRVIASRSSGRHISTALLHAKPYARLLKAVDAPKAQQAVLLREFVDHWYTELKRPPPKNRKAPTSEPFWYIYGDPVTHPLEMGSYFGRWCIEAAAAVKAFELDDSLCLGHEHYPGDLLRPNGPSTHTLWQEPKKGLFARLFGEKRK